MQTQNLTAFGLKDLGAILDSRPAEEYTVERKMTFASANAIERFVAAEDIVLDYESGMSLLILYRGGDAASREVYYLDRTVLLYKGSLFSVAPVRTICTVTLSSKTDEPYIVFDSLPPDILYNSAQQFGFEQLYTLFYQESVGNFYFRGESHEPYELVYVDRGTLHTLVNGQDVVLSQQELMLIDRNSWHIQYSKESVSFLNASFSFTEPLLSSCVNVGIKMNERMKLFINSIMQEKFEPKLYSQAYAEAALQLLLLEVLRTKKTDSRSLDSPALPATIREENRIIDEAVQYISAHIRDKLTLDMLTGALHVSGSYLSNLFKKYLDLSPGKYITMIRLEECKVRLREGTASIGTIAKEMGFSSIQHFSKQFRQQFGYTPTQYSRSFR